MNQPQSHYVYIVRCANGALYTGYAQNVEQRVAVHNAGKGGRYTRSYRPVELMVAWRFGTQREALQVEYRIKQLPRQQKLELAQVQELPAWLLGSSVPAGRLEARTLAANLSKTTQTEK